MAIPNISKPFFTFVVQKCTLASRGCKLHVGAAMCCYGHVHKRLVGNHAGVVCPLIPQVIFKTVTTPDSTNPNAMATEAASCFSNDNVIALTTSGLERTWRVKVEFGCQIENCTISRLEVSKLPKNLYLKGLRTSWTEAKPETGKHANGICIYICMYNYVYIVTGTTERKQWLGRKRLYQYMHTACKCHTCCFSKSRIALIFYCTLPGFRKKFFIGVFYTNVVNQLSVQFL